MFGRLNGKINKYKRKRFTSYIFLIVKNRRICGRAGHDVIHNFGTVRSYQIAESASAFWKEVDRVLNQLTAEKKIYFHDVEKIRKQFSAYVPIPKVAAPPAVPAPTFPKTGIEAVLAKYNLKH
jgi:hypothetical protein